MKPIKYIIVDDEPSAHQILKILLEKYDQYECIGNCYNAFKAISFIKENKPDLMFLDMDMPDLNGLELLKNINQPIRVIITTAHSQYALEGYEYGIVDFLLKPIKAERLFKAMTKVLDIFEPKENMEKLQEPKAVDERSYILGTLDKKKFEKVYFSDILYIEKSGNYLLIHTAKEKIFFVLNSLKMIMSILPDNEFSFVNQSIIIANQKVACSDGKNVIIKDDLAFKVSPLFQNKIKKK